MATATAVEIAIANVQGRPPFVRLVYRPVEDRTASIAAGRPIYRDQIFALITPRGSKDVHEEYADEWIGKMQREVLEGRYPSPWFEAHKQQLENFRKGAETPQSGTPLRQWPGIRPGQLETCHSFQIYTVEELAACNEEAIANIGMGGRALRDAARGWLDAANGPGKVAARLAELEGNNANLAVRNESLERQLKEMQQQLADVRAGQAPTPAPTSAIRADDLFDPPHPPPASPSASLKRL